MKPRPPIELALAIAFALVVFTVPQVQVRWSEATIAQALPQVDAATLSNLVVEQQQPTVVMFSASWCFACEMQRSDLATVAMQYEDRVTTVVVDVDEEEVLAQQIGIQSLPTTVAYGKGGSVGAALGVYPAKQLAQLYEAVLADPSRAPVPHGHHHGHHHPH